MANLADFMNNRQNNITALKEALAKQNQKGYAEDDRFWYPQTDKTGSAEAVIRFLPSLPEEDLAAPWVQTYAHNWHGPQNWYIENCPTTVDPQNYEACPLCMYNNSLYQMDKEAAKAIVSGKSGVYGSGSKRRMSYVANIVVIDDKQNPENNGKVRLFRFGLKIYEQIMGKLAPKFTSIDPVMVHSLDKGADYFFRICKVAGQTNYEQSSFANSAPLYGGDAEKITAVISKIYPLKPFISPTAVKSFEKLSARLAVCLGKNSGKPAGQVAAPKPSSGLVEVVKAPTPVAAPAAPAVDEVPGDEGTDTLDYFKELAESA